jgi:flagellar motility protein MotE (MotC chaperone)
MGKYLLGVVTVLIMIGVAAGSLYLCDLVGVIKLQDLVLTETGRLLGIEDLAFTYELGKKHSDVLQKKEDELAKRERRLAARETQLQLDVTELQDQKQLWLKERSKADSVKLSRAKNSSGPLATPDPALKNYLEIIGAMKAEKAAAVIQKLPDEIVFLILNQLRTQQAAKLMENLPPDYLTRLTKARVKK